MLYVLCKATKCYTIYSLEIIIGMAFLKDQGLVKEQGKSWCSKWAAGASKVTSTKVATDLAGESWYALH